MNPVDAVIEQLDLIIKNVEQALSVQDPKEPSQKKMSNPSSDTSVQSSPETQLPADKSLAVSTENPKKKNKKAKQPEIPARPPLPVEVTQFLQCDLRVGRVAEVASHPEASGLYILKVSYGDMGTRSVCAGLRNFLSEDDLRERLVVTICNLKPLKLRGVSSEAMILAGSVVSSEGAKETVVPLGPPSQAQEGDIVSVQGIDEERTVIEGKFVSKKVWDKVVPRLSVVNGSACYNGSPFVVGEGVVVCNLPDGAEIH